MKKIALLLVLFWWEGVYAKNLLLVEFNTDSYDSTVVWLREVESKGATVRHMFPPNKAIVDMHQLPPNLLNGVSQGEIDLFTVERLKHDPMLFSQCPVRQAFLHLMTAEAEITNGEYQPEPLKCLDYAPPPGLNLDSQSGPTSRTAFVNMLTGQYLIGKVAVGIYLMESNGSQENW